MRQFSFLKWMAQAMAVSLKTENEEYTENTAQTRRSEGGRRSFTGTGQRDTIWRVAR